MDKVKYKKIPSIVGELTVVAKDETLLAILWDCEKPNRVPLEPMIEANKDLFLLTVEKELSEYFKGNRKTFTLPLQLKGSDFQQAVWNQLLQIPYGTTCSYKEVASILKRPDAVRAVAAAIGRNPISIVIPCHRVIASNGSLTGFAGGLARKQTLLNLENFVPAI